MQYSTAATRWQVIVFDYDTDYPVDNDVHLAPAKVASRGVTSISLSRGKSSIQNVCQIEIVGRLPSFYREGNWAIIKSKVGQFLDETKPSEPEEGTVRFFGQIVDIQSEYTKMGNGLLARRHSISIREWSSLLNCPVRFEFGAAEQAILNSGNDSAASEITGRIGAAEQVKDVSDFSIKFAEAQYDPFDYIRTVLAFIGFASGNQTGTPIELSDSSNRALEDFASNISKTALYLPHVPKEVLNYLGVTNVDPQSAFNSNGGIAGLVIGVQNKDKDDTFGLTESGQFPDKKAFKGVFTSFSDIQSRYQNYKDRPRSSGFFADFSQGRSAWDIIQSRCDKEYNECFTDIWYTQEPVANSLQETSSFSIPQLPTNPLKQFESKPVVPRKFAKPVIVMRDKPYALRKYFEQSGISNNWSVLDNVPRVWIDNTLILRVIVKNTFYNSPNYILPQIADNVVSDSFSQKNTLLAFATRTQRPEMNRFGGIEYFYNTPFVALSTDNERLDQSWFSDATKIQYLWHSLNYRFATGTIMIKDNDVPIMVGCNISFQFGENTFCAHVENVSWSLNVGSDGLAQTICTVNFSYLTKVLSDGSLDFAGATTLAELTAFSAEQSLSLKLADKFKALGDIFKKIEDLQNTVKKGQELLKKLTEFF